MRLKSVWFVASIRAVVVSKRRKRAVRTRRSCRKNNHFAAAGIRHPTTELASSPDAKHGALCFRRARQPLTT
jgi:hypothetical protein